MARAASRYPILLSHFRYQEADRAYHVPAHKHAMWQWYHVMAGDVNIKIDQENHRLRAGDHILIPPHRMRSPSCAGRAPRYVISMFKCRSLLLETIAARTWTLPKSLDDTLQSLIDELRQPGPHGEAYRTCLMTHILFSMLRHADSSAQSATTSRLNTATQMDVVERAESFIRTNLHRKILARDIAKAVHLSPTHLGRLFRSHRSQSIGQRLTELRLEYARLLLLESNLSITQIAAEVGFNSFSHFTQTFRQHIGASPSDVRRSRGVAWTHHV